MRKCIFIAITKEGLTFLIITTIIVCLLPTIVIYATIKKAAYHDALSGKVIVVDPGHGGVDSGTHYAEKIFEKNINLAIGLKLKEQLVSKGATVIMTREVDDSLDDHIKNGSRHREDLNARVNIINKNQADIFISIHVNSIRSSPSTLGPMVFFYGSSEKSKYLAECIQESLNNLSAYAQMGNRAKHSANRGNYVILRETSPPGVIIETGFISNATDRTLLQKEKHQQEIAERICKGIIEYFGSIQ
ncbi:MAG: N-acetylmuramoyl-L-alanine amidase [Clostridiales bacterium]|jgi:N-acetylmuramoyl-L-alanine amidase|nr:N-acetylmuramoyl-L-alanine amidase [Clostridiales bacterium]